MRSHDLQTIAPLAGSARAAALATATLALLAAGPARAFTFETVVSGGCHEALSLAALERATWPEGAQVQSPSRDDQVLAANLPFRVPADVDLWTMALLVGVRDNDLRGAAPTDFVELSETHNGGHLQAEHCLRNPEQDGAAGDAAAVESCRAFIRSEVALALGDGALSATEPVRVALRYQAATVELPRFAFHMGRALHALQDSFTHAYRTAGHHRLATVFNYAEPALSQSFRTGRDGLEHRSDFDKCRDGAAEPTERARVAAQASAELLAAAALTGTPEERLHEVDGVLDTWVQYQPGCSAADLWCGGSEEETDAGCAAAPAGPLAAAGLLLLALRRRARSVRGTPAVAALAALALVAAPTAARADDVAATASQAVSDPGPESRAWTSARFKLHLLTGLSVDRGAASVSTGATVDLGTRWALGLELEYSPWFDVMAGTFAPGTASAQGTLSFRWATLGRFELRTSVHGGMSVLLFDAPGAPAGSVGVVLGASPLRVAIQVGPRVAFELVPEVVLSAPSLKGMPLVYRQYRLSAGFRFGL